MNTRLTAPLQALRIGIGLMATLAGLDKFFNILADWASYVSPLAAQILPVSPAVLMPIVGVVEIGVGVCILAVAPRIGAYAASVWLLLVAGNLVTGGYLDIAVRDVVLAIAAFSLARLVEVNEVADNRATSLRLGDRAATAQ
jgi:uncharacterized membrane protein YphA (DoxX/SURF4 family)